MKNFILSLVCTFLFSSISVASSDAVKNYKVTYEIKNRDNVDSSLLSMLQIDKYENQRTDYLRVEITDAGTGLTVILYSRSEVEQKETLKQQLRNAKGIKVNNSISKVTR